MMITPTERSPFELDGKAGSDDRSKENQSLCYLLRVQGLFGVTYCGSTPFGENNVLKRIFMASYDILQIVMFFGVFYLAFSNDSFDRIFQRASNKGVMRFVFNLSGSTLIIEYLVIKVMIMKNGKELISTIQSIGYVSNKKQMYFIGFLTFITSIVMSLGMTLNFVDLEKTFVQFYAEEKVKAILFILTGFNNGIVRSSILMLLLYNSFVIQRQLLGNAENFQNNLVRKPMKLCQAIIELRTKIERLNSLTGIIMFVKTISNSIEISGCFCVLAVGQLDLTSKISIACFICLSSTEIIISCRSSQLIMDAFHHLCTTIENKLSSYSFTDDDYRQLKVIISMKNSIRYQVLNLFDLKDLTILSIIGYIANYAVILIQTQ